MDVRRIKDRKGLARRSLMVITTARRVMAGPGGGTTENAGKARRKLLVGISCIALERSEDGMARRHHLCSTLELGSYCATWPARNTPNRENP